jgi:hypothetical protein
MRRGCAEGADVQNIYHYAVISASYSNRVLIPKAIRDTYIIRVGKAYLVFRPVHRIVGSCDCGSRPLRVDDDGVAEGFSALHPQALMIGTSKQASIPSLRFHSLHLIRSDLSSHNHQSLLPPLHTHLPRTLPRSNLSLLYTTRCSANPSSRLSDQHCRPSHPELLFPLRREPWPVVIPVPHAQRARGKSCYDLPMCTTEGGKRGIQ